MVSGGAWQIKIFPDGIERQMSRDHYIIRPGVLPDAILNSREFCELSPVKQSNFASRISHIEETTRQCLSYVKNSDNRPALEFIDDISLDLFSILSLGDSDRQVSPWLVHSSWLFDCSYQEIKNCPQIHEVCEQIRPIYAQSWGESDFAEELFRHGRGIERLLYEFRNSDSFCCAICLLISIDSIIASLLSYLAMQRLNPVVSE